MASVRKTAPTTQEQWHQLMLKLPNASDKQEVVRELDGIIAAFTGKNPFLHILPEERVSILQFCQKFSDDTDIQDKIKQITSIAWQRLISSLPSPSRTDVVEKTLDEMLALLSNQIYQPIVSGEERSAILNFCAKVNEMDPKLLLKTELVADIVFPMITAKNLTKAKSATFHHREEDVPEIQGAPYNIDLRDILAEESLTDEHVRAIQNFLTTGEIEIKESNLIALLEFDHYSDSKDLRQKINEWIQNHQDNILLNDKLLKKLKSMSTYYFDDYPKLRELLFIESTGCVSNKELLEKIDGFIKANPGAPVLDNDIRKLLEQKHEHFIDVLPSLKDFLPQVNLKGQARRAAAVTARNNEAQIKLQEADTALQTARNTRKREWKQLAMWSPIPPLAGLGIGLYFGAAIALPLLAVTPVGWAIFGGLGGLGVVVGLTILLIWGLVIHFTTKVKVPEGYPFTPDPLIQERQAREVCNQLRKSDVSSMTKKGYTGDRLFQTGLLSKEDALMLDILIAKQSTANVDKEWKKLQGKISRDLPF